MDLEIARTFSDFYELDEFVDKLSLPLWEFEEKMSKVIKYLIYYTKDKNVKRNLKNLAHFCKKVEKKRNDFLFLKDIIKHRGKSDTFVSVQVENKYTEKCCFINIPCFSWKMGDDRKKKVTSVVKKLISHESRLCDFLNWLFQKTPALKKLANFRLRYQLEDFIATK